MDEKQISSCVQLRHKTSTQLNRNMDKKITAMKFHALYPLQCLTENGSTHRGSVYCNSRRLGSYADNPGDWLVARSRITVLRWLRRIVPRIGRDMWIR
jgi:hypothetical protein